MRYSHSFGKISSKILLGTAYFGDAISKDDAFCIMDKYCEMGGCHIDTARLYADGVAEKVIGEWLRDRKPEGKIKKFGALCSIEVPDVFPIIGGSRVEQIEDSMRGADVIVEDGELKALFGF